MKNDIIDVMEACVDGKLDAIDLQFEDNAAVCVVLASDGYPVAYEKGFPISGFEKFEERTIISAFMREPNSTRRERSSRTEDA